VIEENLDVLRLIIAFYESSRLVERSEFRSFVASAVARFRGFQALEWIPRVPASERAAYEEAARQRVTDVATDAVFCPFTRYSLLLTNLRS